MSLRVARKTARAAPLLATVLLLAACATTSATTAEEVTFDPALAVDLSAMERITGGVYVQDLVEGDGTEVRTGHRIQIYYAAWIPDGTLVDGSAPPDDPMEFRVGERQVIRGLEQAVRGMRPGGQRRLVIPPAMGYGSTRVAGVPPNSVLVFIVELVRAR